MNESLIQDINSEVARAIDKFPKWPSDPIHAATIIAEECGELQKAILEAVYEPNKEIVVSHIRDEAVQTAAMCMRFIDSLDNHKYQWFPSNQHHQNNKWGFK